MLNPQQTSGVGGWLLVVCALLIVWQPLNVGLAASTVLDALPGRGVPLALVLMLRLLVAAAGIGAGLALIARHAGAATLAKVAVAASAATDLFVYATPYIPAIDFPATRCGMSPHPSFTTASF